MYMKLKGGPRISLVTMITLKKKPKSTICSDHCTISLIRHIAKIVVSILIRIERKFLT